jgi:hypothetical protein
MNAKFSIVGILGAITLLGSSGAQASTATSTHNTRPQQTGPAADHRGAQYRKLGAERRAAAKITTAQANALQALAVARGEANSALSNPFIEQKVTVPESTGHNATQIPAGGF